MKKLILILLLLMPVVVTAQNFDKFFLDKTVRMNYIIAGNCQKTEIYLSKFLCNENWTGTKNHLIQKNEYGPFKLQISDKKSGEIIYTYTYSSLFFEWQMTEEALNVSKAFREAVKFPMPKNQAVIEFFKRDSLMRFQKVFSTDFDPSSKFIEKGNYQRFTVKNIIENGNPKEKYDLIFVPEGFTQNELTDFEKLAKEYAEKLFDYEPFKSQKDMFNIRIISAASEESGADIPNKNIWKNTIADFGYSVFDVDRYVMTENYWAVCDAASSAPWDGIIVLVNSDIYGGGGIYNYYGAFAAKNPMSIEIFVHEFGHLFAGLADEYESDGAFIEESNKNYDYEPYEPNITTLKNFQSKWKDMVNAPIPTPKTQKYENAVGAFEGGNYQSKGFYRPSMHCIMRRLEDKMFCPVCKRAITDAVKYWSE